MLLNPSNRKEILKIQAPSSKSIEHRALITSFLEAISQNPINEGVCNSVTKISEGDSKDIYATKLCLRALYSESTKNEPSSEVEFECNESGSTLRFMISVAISLLSVCNVSKNRRLIFKCKGRLLDRPLEGLVKCLESHGISIVKDSNASAYIVSGVLQGGEFEIEGGTSSQYISGLLMGLPRLNENSQIKVCGNIQSRKYIDLTIDALHNIGIGIDNTKDETHESYLIKGNSYGSYTASLEEIYNNVEGDWSNGAFLLCLGALYGMGEIEVSGLNPSSKQGDRAILDFFKLAGIEAISNNSQIVLKGNKNSTSCERIEMDCANIPDIVPYMVIVSAFYAKEAIFNNTSRLRIKETDRVMAICEMAREAGINITENENSIEVRGLDESFDKDIIKLSSYNDHRMAMCALLIAEGRGISVDIDEIECIRKSFPALIDIINKEYAR